MRRHRDTMNPGAEESAEDNFERLVVTPEQSQAWKLWKQQSLGWTEIGRRLPIEKGGRRVERDRNWAKKTVQSYQRTMRALVPLVDEYRSLQKGETPASWAEKVRITEPHWKATVYWGRKIRETLVARKSLTRKARPKLTEEWYERMKTEAAKHLAGQLDLPEDLA